MENLLDFYRDVYCGVEYPELERLLKRSENEIGGVIFMSPEGDEQVRLYEFAVCAQAEYMGLSGGIEAWAAKSSGDIASVSVGAFSMSYGGNSGSSGGGSADGICGRALEYLAKAGLLYRGVGAI